MNYLFNSILFSLTHLLRDNVTRARLCLWFQTPLSTQASCREEEDSEKGQHCSYARVHTIYTRSVDHKSKSKLKVRCKEAWLAAL
jgi:CRISPR/Cas system-associated protein Cas10 (large subunit of type III CRISPR-Cas system)